MNMANAQVGSLEANAGSSAVNLKMGLDRGLGIHLKSCFSTFGGTQSFKFQQNLVKELDCLCNATILILILYTKLKLQTL